MVAFADVTFFALSLSLSLSLYHVPLFVVYVTCIVIITFISNKNVVGVQAKPNAAPEVDVTMGDGAAVQFSDLPDSPSATAGGMVSVFANCVAGRELRNSN